VGEEDRAFDALREAIEAFAAERAPGLVAEARAEAVAKARSMLVEAMAEALLREAGDEFETGRRPARAAPVPKRTTSRAKPAPPAPGREKPRPRRRPPKVQKRPEPGPRPSPARGERPRPRPQGAREEGLGYYVYGVVSAQEADLPADLAGVDPRHPVALLEHHDLAAIVSRVSLDEFGEEQLHENLNDVEWLEDKARAHEEVLDAALSRMTVVPMRLCTIYRSEEQVHEMLGRERPLLGDALRRLDGKTEWGVKLVAEPDALQRAAAQAGADAASETGADSEGTAYMDRKRREARAREEQDRIAEEWAAEVHERLADAAAEALLNPIQRPEVSGYAGEMLLNGVYLVTDSEVEGFRRLVEELADAYRERGALVDLTGPWPPYNFVKSSIEAAR
jgi:Gas vesicle synthesis protein GvpL/GvpF